MCDIMVFLHSNGVGIARAVRIYKTYGAEAIQKSLPSSARYTRYRLQDCRHYRYEARHETTTMVRIRAGISYALTEAMSDRHCVLPLTELVKLVAALVDAPVDLIKVALDMELKEAAVITDTIQGVLCIFLAGLYHAEKMISARLLTISHGPMPWGQIDSHKALPWIAQKTGLTLAKSQIEAMSLALSAKAMVITGGPGVGKTTIVNSILRILSAKGVDLLLCAPTGRAAKRMSEATDLEAKTIHRLLEIDPKSGGFKRNAENPIKCDLLVIDEASMVDVMLMQALLKAVPDKAALLIVGDIDQLPSVGPGQILSDIIAS